MDTPTFEQLISKVEAQQAEIDELRAGLNYAVYGIGNPHPDPRDKAEATGV